jgi:hypothetical protein
MSRTDSQAAGNGDGYEERAGAVDSSHEMANLVYEAFYAAGLGGSIVALFFLLVDVAAGQALLTPTIMGSVLFLGVSAASVTQADLGMVAYYSGVHFVTFGLLGACVSFIVHEVELHAKHPANLLLLIFGVFELAFFTAAATLLPGVLEYLGVVRVAVANLLAAGGIALFMVSTHRPDLWQEWKNVLRSTGSSPD